MSIFSLLEAIQQNSNHYCHKNNIDIGLDHDAACQQYCYPEQIFPSIPFQIAEHLPDCQHPKSPADQISIHKGRKMCIRDRDSPCSARNKITFQKRRCQFIITDVLSAPLLFTLPSQPQSTSAWFFSSSLLEVS